MKPKNRIAKIERLIDLASETRDKFSIDTISKSIK